MTILDKIKADTQRMAAVGRAWSPSKHSVAPLDAEEAGTEWMRHRYFWRVAHESKRPRVDLYVGPFRATLYYYDDPTQDNWVAFVGIGEDGQRRSLGFVSFEAMWNYFLGTEPVGP